MVLLLLPQTETHECAMDFENVIFTYAALIIALRAIHNLTESEAHHLMDMIPDGVVEDTSEIDNYITCVFGYVFTLLNYTELLKRIHPVSLIRDVMITEVLTDNGYMMELKLGGP